MTRYSTTLTEMHPKYSNINRKLWVTTIMISKWFEIILVLCFTNWTGLEKTEGNLCVWMLIWTMKGKSLKLSERFFMIFMKHCFPSSFLLNRFLYKEDLDRWTRESQWRSDSINYLCAFCIIFIILFIFRRQFTLFLIGLCRLFRVRKRERSLTSINLHSIWRYE